MYHLLLISLLESIKLVLSKLLESNKISKDEKLFFQTFLCTVKLCLYRLNNDFEFCRDG